MVGALIAFVSLVLFDIQAAVILTMFELEKFRVRGNRTSELLRVSLIAIAGPEMRVKIKSIRR